MYDVIIIGSGPAGLMAGIEASKSNKTLIIEKNSISGKKLLLTGGGRCNLTNLKTNKNFLEEIDYNKKYLYSAINKFGPEDIYNFFTLNKVLLKIEKEDKVFPVSDKSGDILGCLLENTTNVEFKYSEYVVDILIRENYKEILTNKDTYKTNNVIIATGGSSYKVTGSTGDNMKFARMLNQPTVELFPAEVGVVLEEKTDLAGTSIENVVIKYNKYKKNGNLIFTHKGLSGTSIMKMSEHIYLNPEKNISIDFLPFITKEELIDLVNNFDREKEISTFLSNLFSKRFSTYILDRCNVNNGKIKTINSKNLLAIVSLIKDCTFKVKEVDSIDVAYATGGGIDMKYIDSTTMESTINKGIYFVGEALDIHGPIGGYNITLALSTGYLAGSSIDIK